VAYFPFQVHPQSLKNGSKFFEPWLGAGNKYPAQRKMSNFIWFDFLESQPT